MTYTEQTIRPSLLDIVKKIDQVKPEHWLNGLVTGKKTEDEIQEEITHVFIEYQKKEPWTPYESLVQRGNSLVTKKTRKNIFEIVWRGIESPWSRLQAETLSQFYRNIIKTENASIAFIFSPPEPKNKNKKDKNYGLCYIFSIPELKNDKREIESGALRINECSAETVRRCLELLSAFGQSASLNIRNKEDETLLTSFVIAPIGQSVSSNSQTHHIKRIKNLLSLISDYLPDKLNKKDIPKMLARDVVKETYLKFKDIIDEGLDWLRTKASKIKNSVTHEHDLPPRTRIERDIGEFFAILAQQMDLRNLIGGSCPAVAANSISPIEKADQGTDIKTDYCPRCEGPQLFSNGVCLACGWQG